MLPWKLRKRHILPASQNLLSVYFALAKFQLVSCNLSLTVIWQRTYTHKLPKLPSATLKSECADIFHQSFLWLLCHTDEPPKERNSCLWLQSRSVLSSFSVVLMSCRVNFSYSFHVVRSASKYSAYII